MSAKRFLTRLWNSFSSACAQRRLLFILSPLFITLLACSAQSGTPLREAIIGKWINAQDFTIEFYADGTGFIPGTEGQMPIPAADFNYVVTDESHIRIMFGDLSDAIVAIKIDGDQMTWQNADASVTFVYTRVK